MQQFFTEYLVAQRAVSPRTVACYRDALMLFLDFASRKLGKAPTAMRLADIQPELILAFLDHLEHERHNSVRSRNLRLTALRAFLKFAGRRDVASLHVVEQALAVPMKRFERPMLGFLTREEMLAVLGQPGESWSSQRDHLLLAHALQHRRAGLRDHRRARRRCRPRRRRLRASARQGTQAALGSAVEDHRRGDPRLAAAEPNAAWRGRLAAQPRWPAMTRSNVAQRLDLAVARAAASSPASKKRVSPHTLRHTTAMHLLQSGVPFNVIALWLGHESPNTTHRYVEADLAMKEKALARLEAPDITDAPVPGARLAHAVPADAITMRRLCRLQPQSPKGPARYCA